MGNKERKSQLFFTAHSKIVSWIISGKKWNPATSRPEQEIQNIRKYLEAGYDYVIFHLS